MPRLVGGEVDGYCTKCKMVLAHVILAMVGERIVRVRCNTCMGEHAYKAAAPGEPKPKAAKSVGGGARLATGTRSKAQAASFDDQLASKNGANAKTYSVNEKYALDQVLDHPTFGRGFVAGARADKIDVVFRSFVKTLVHARGGKPAVVHAPIPARPVTEPDANLAEAMAAAPADEDSGSAEA